MQYCYKDLLQIFFFGYHFKWHVPVVLVTLSLLYSAIRDSLVHYKTRWMYSLWSLRYGFRSTPSLWLSAKPWVGEREVSFSHVTDWIEKKLAVEFQVRRVINCVHRCTKMPGKHKNCTPYLRCIRICTYITSSASMLSFIKVMDIRKEGFYGNLGRN